MLRAQIEECVADIFQAVLGLKLERGTNATRSSIAAWDSLKHVEIIFMLEDELSIEFSESQMAEIDSVEKLIDAAWAKYEA